MTTIFEETNPPQSSHLFWFSSCFSNTFDIPSTFLTYSYLYSVKQNPSTKHLFIVPHISHKPVEDNEGIQEEDASSDSLL